MLNKCKFLGLLMAVDAGQPWQAIQQKEIL